MGSDESLSFVGSDFYNGDVYPTDINDSQHTWLGTKTIDFIGSQFQVEKIESVFKSDQKKRITATAIKSNGFTPKLVYSLGLNITI